MDSRFQEGPLGPSTLSGMMSTGRKKRGEERAGGQLQHSCFKGVGRGMYV